MIMNKKKTLQLGYPSNSLRFPSPTDMITTPVGSLGTDLEMLWLEPINITTCWSKYTAHHPRKSFVLCKNLFFLFNLKNTRWEIRQIYISSQIYKRFRFKFWNVQDILILLKSIFNRTLKSMIQLWEREFKK